MLLYDPGRHETLTATPWDEARARAAIAGIVADTDAAFTPEGLWPIHPLDLSPERPPDCLKMLYNGAAGVIWALHDLADSGLAPPARDHLATVRGLALRHRQDIATHRGVRDYLGNEHSAYLFGETGLHLLQWKLAPSDEIADRLHAAIESKLGDVRGLVWGGAGAMLAALFLHQSTADPRWRDSFLSHAEALWERWAYADAFGCHLWTSDLYGVVEKRLGALHGFLANVAPLVRGRHLLAPDRGRELLRRIGETVRATALRAGHMSNWPNNAEALTGDAPPRLYVQHCNGPTGLINVLADLPPDPFLDDLLRQAGDLVWQAGPLAKLPGLCHGTPGNGFALLKLYARTGDAEWLARARCFAMHAIAQSETARARHGMRKFSLWTGDLGLALFLAACIAATPDFPTLDRF